MTKDDLLEHSLSIMRKQGITLGIIEHVMNSMMTEVSFSHLEALIRDLKEIRVKENWLNAETYGKTSSNT